MKLHFLLSLSFYLNDDYMLYCNTNDHMSIINGFLPLSPWMAALSVDLTVPRKKLKKTTVTTQELLTVYIHHMVNLHYF